MMKELIQAFPDHIAESLAIFKKTALHSPKAEIRNVVISGLGGSGIGGTIVSDLSRPASSVPVCVNKEYTTPAFVNANTLFIASSYSGGTEETLMAVEDAHKKGAHIICITSGGRLAEFAAANGLDALIIPGGHPPRACLGYSLTQLVCILSHFSILPIAEVAVLEKAAARLKAKQELICTTAAQQAGKLFKKRVIIYADAAMEGVAVRFRQQLNENAKMLAWHHVVPEMNHNELVGWTEKNDQLAVVFLRNQNDFARNQTRMEINKGIIQQYTPHVYELFSEGDTVLEKMLYHIHLEDWITFYLAEMNEVDIMDIRVIDYLKGELAKL